MLGSSICPLKSTYTLNSLFTGESLTVFPFGIGGILLFPTAHALQCRSSGITSIILAIDSYPFTTFRPSFIVDMER